MWIDRRITDRLKQAILTRPVVLLTGARQTGKTSLLRRVAVEADYVSLDNYLTAASAEENPVAFLSSFHGQVILDEMQYAPSLFRELKAFVDQRRHLCGKWLLTGSQKFQLMGGISESLAGRIGILNLETLSADELRRCGHFADDKIANFLFRGGFPELWENPLIDAFEYYESYIQTYLERDLKELVQVVDLRLFRRMLQFAALRTAQLVNYSEVGKDTGVSLNTVKKWLVALEVSGVVHLLPPFHANLGKRLAKSPKFYFADHGLAGHLLGVDASNYDRTPHRGAIWENLVFSELLKTLSAIPGRNLFHYRDQNRVEIDFVYETAETRYLIEAKATENPSSAKLNFDQVAPLFKDKPVKSVLMAAIPHGQVVRMGRYDVVNPLRCNYFDDK